MAIPSLSPEQLQAARAAATQARRARAALKDDVKAGRLTMAAALDKAMANEVLAHVKVVDLLRSLPRVGVKRADEIMERLGIAQNRRVRGLGRHQIALLKAEFE
ncbi:MAG: 30S ribosomal protein S13 [Propionibacterium sp.]|nr:MAG: 30S ribosomal protein S13 [Propionibacterium sp.]